MDILASGSRRIFAVLLSENWMAARMMALFFWQVHRLEFHTHTIGAAPHKRQPMRW